MASNDVFPIKNQQAVCDPLGIPTEILLTGYSDKIFVVITQYGKIGSLICSSLDVGPNMPSNLEDLTTTSKTIFGSESDLYNVYASRLCQAIVVQKPHERRPILLGIALKPETEMDKERERLKIIVDTIMDNPVW